MSVFFTFRSLVMNRGFIGARLRSLIRSSSAISNFFSVAFFSRLFVGQCGNGSYLAKVSFILCCKPDGSDWNNEDSKSWWQDIFDESRFASPLSCTVRSCKNAQRVSSVASESTSSSCRTCVSTLLVFRSMMTPPWSLAGMWGYFPLCRL